MIVSWRWLTRWITQGGQITDDALCGGGDTNEGYSNTAVTFSSSAVNMIKAAILMGDPRFIAGKSYDVGTCKAGGVSHTLLLKVAAMVESKLTSR